MLDLITTTKQKIKCFFGYHRWRLRVDFKVFRDSTEKLGSKVFCKYCKKGK